MEMTLGEYLSSAYNKIDKKYKVCFYSAIICALLAHIFAMTNHLYNYDELYHSPAGFGTGVQQGRWALSILAVCTKALFKRTFTIPVINGAITIVCYSLCACIVVGLFNIKDDFLAGIIGALMVTFPALTCRMFYMFTTHFYAIGILITACSVLILIKCNKNIVTVMLSMFLLSFGVGVYQTNFVTGVCLIVGYLLIKFIETNETVKARLQSIVSNIVFLGVTMVLYFIENKIALIVTGYEMDKHVENYDTMGNLGGVSQIVGGVIRCYRAFFRLAIKDTYAMNPTYIVKGTYFVSMIIMVYTLIKVLKSGKNLADKILITMIMAIIPLAVNLIIVMTISSGVMYSIMTYEMVYVFVIAIGCLSALGNSGNLFFDESSEMTKAKKMYGLLNVIAAVFFSATVITYIWFANGNYLALDYTNKHDIAYFTTLMSQIKSTEGYESNMPIVPIGMPDSDDPSIRGGLIDDVFNLAGKTGSIVGQYSYWNMFRIVLGFDPGLRNSDEDEEFFNGLEEVKNMPVYPENGSIRVIDNSVVIKFE